MSIDYLPIPQPDGTVLVKARNGDSVHTKTLEPGRFTAANTWEDTDISNEPTVVKDVVTAWWTVDRVRNYKQAHPWVAPPPKPAQQIAREAIEADQRVQDLITQLRGATPNQIVSYVNTSVTDLASAKVLLAKLTLVLGAMLQ